MFTNSANNIITNSTVVEKIINADSTLKATITPTFILMIVKMYLYLLLK